MFRRRHAPEHPAAQMRENHAAPPSAAGLPAPAEPGRDVRTWLLRSLGGRLILGAAAVKIVASLVQLVTPLPAAVRALSSGATLILLGAATYLVWRGIVAVKRRLLWRVRRKLILSYVFIGFVPTLLVMALVLFGGLVVFLNVSAYVFRDGYDEVVTEMRVFARTIQVELRQAGADPLAIADRYVVQRQVEYPDLSIVLLPAGAAPVRGRPVAPAAAGPWRHVGAPTLVPDWVAADGFAGSLTFAPADAPQELQLLIRVVERPPEGGGYAVVVDLPVNGSVVERLRERTGIRAGGLTVASSGAGALPQPAAPAAESAPTATPDAALRPVASLWFDHSVAMLEVTDWQNGHTSLGSISLSVRMGELYDRISVQGLVRSNLTLGQLFLFALIAVSVLFLIIEFVALVMGSALARSITSSVHELFMGTERVRQGDFTHRINVKTRDQLGELADSFNQMTSSIEGLLVEAARKKQLEEELRIAREIQMSLLPTGPLALPGLAVTAICEPAREVGGDYYDFFPLSDRRVGVLIADVAGKGTFAALYMAELKGLMLSLSQVYHSPRQLLIEVNRILAEHLASRSFITMTYIVIDLGAMRMTYCRAGHTPMVYVPAHGRVAQLLTPSGMVVGLRLPGAEHKFAELLEEVDLRLHAGDVFALYTDGISEAMNEENELFGESRLTRLIEEHGHLDSTELRERIMREIKAFVGAAEQHDDQTMILLKVEEAAGQPVRAAASAVEMPEA
jgi:sigma-B regulation protein RsbU (phosphoserine phosphatase)